MATEAKTVIVTGASQGVGAGVAKAFLNRGYRVVANSRRITHSGAFSPSDHLALVDGDIGNPQTATKIAETAVGRFGSIDALVNPARCSTSTAGRTAASGEKPPGRSRRTSALRPHQPGEDR